MTSLIKVDTIQTSAGGTPTASSLGIGGTGKIGQIVQNSYSTTVFNATSTFADTGISHSITPSSTSSKILVLVNVQGAGKQNNNTQAQFRLLRGSTQIHLISSLVGGTASSAENYIGTVSTTYLDSPSTTSATTYKIQFKSTTNTSTVAVNNYGASAGSSVSMITLMEVLV